MSSPATPDLLRYNGPNSFLSSAVVWPRLRVLTEEFEQLPQDGEIVASDGDCVARDYWRRLLLDDEDGPGRSREREWRASLHAGMLCTRDDHDPGVVLSAVATERDRRAHTTDTLTCRLVRLSESRDHPIGTLCMEVVDTSEIHPHGDIIAGIQEGSKTRLHRIGVQDEEGLATSLRDILSVARGDQGVEVLRAVLLEPTTPYSPSAS